MKTFSKFEKDTVNLGFASVDNVFSQGNNLIYHPINYILLVQYSANSISKTNYSVVHVRKTTDTTVQSTVGYGYGV